MEFSNRTDALAQALNIKVTELPSKMGISNGTLFANRKGNQKISKKTWAKLELLERHLSAPDSEKEAISGHRLRSPMVAEIPHHGGYAPGQATKFAEYLAFIRGCRMEAERLGAGNAIKTQEIFDKLLATYMHDADAPK